MTSQLFDFDLTDPIAGVDPMARVGATEAALDLLGAIRVKYGPISIHHGGGCCDGTDPMCLPEGELKLGSGDTHLGNIDGVPVYVSGGRADAWQSRQFILDVVRGHGGMFSLDNGTGRRFLTRSRVFSADACAALGLALPEA